MSALEMPTDGVARRPLGNGSRKARPFAAIDNPTLSPDYDHSLPPSPVPPDWALVREDPSDQPEYMAGGRAARAGGASAVLAPNLTSGSIAALPAHHPSSDLQDLDSLLMDNGSGLHNEHSTRTRDWLPDDFDHPPEVSPKKRRVERVVCNDIDEAIDFPMQMPTPFPLELDLDHAAVDVGPHEQHDVHPDLHHDLHADMHADIHPDMHPDLVFSYHEEEEELHLHPMPMPRRHPHPALVPSRTHAHPHNIMHPQDFMHEMDMFAPVEHERVPHARRSPHGRSPPHNRASPHSRSPATSPHVSPSQMQARRVATMGRHTPRPPSYGARYMNAYVPSVPVPMGSASAYYRRAYSRPPQYRYLNPANLPPTRIRKAYHLSPMAAAAAERRVFVCPEDETFHRHSFFPADPSGVAAADLDHMDETSPSSVTAIDLALDEESTALPMSAETKRLGLPAMKLSSRDPAAKAVPSLRQAEDKKPSPKKDAPAASAPSPQPASVPTPEIAKEEEVVHFSKREHISLAIDEDANWLSEFQTYVRLEFLEIFRANLEDVKFRNTSRKVAHKQLGIRCRFCAHVHPGSRARRSSAYPSSTAQIYQSFNMMIRDHFPRCEHVPKDKMDMFQRLKGRNNQGAADSKHFWSHAAEKLGMVDSESGIFMDKATQRAALAKPPFSTTEKILATARDPPVLLVTADDRPLISPFLYELMFRIQRVNLLDCECRSTRKNLKVGLPGFGCRYCCEAGRLGFSRIFPTKRKGLPEKANDMYEHMRRCSLCPSEVKKRLGSLRPKKEDINSSTEKVFFDRVWARLNGGVSP